MNLSELTEIHYRKALKAYLYVALSLYVKHEAKISFWNDENFGDTANIICSLNRAIEHLLKLKLIKTDSRLLYKSPQDFIEYCIVNKIPFSSELKNFYLECKKKDLEQKRLQLETYYFLKTVDFGESMKRVEEIIGTNVFDFKHFIDIHNLRNYLEHNWSGKEEEFLRRIIEVMAYEAIPTIKEYITKVLGEDYKYFFDERLLEQMEELNEALRNNHSIALNKRYKAIKKLFKENPERCCEEYSYPMEYRNLFEIEISSKCPICKNKFLALFNLEADYDYADGESYIAGVYPKIRCLHCNKCCFYIEGIDIKTYFPDSSEIDLDEYFKEDYEEYY